MQIYQVGGCVRDRLLGRVVNDHDWVVVGSTPEAMIALGYRPVGRDFPVFLHPSTHEEYALARTERKTAPGYAGFAFHAAPDVTLEQDLGRRDLTINAMAQDDRGVIVDPFGGRRDLAERVLRHVGPSFIEDPVRILRLARFAARFAQFHVAAQTMELMRRMVDGGEVDALVPERVWQEIARALMEDRPSRMVEVLSDCGLTARLYPELVRAPPPVEALDRAAAAQLALPARFAVFCASLAPEALDGLLARLRTDAACADLARLFVRGRSALPAAASVGTASAARLLEVLETTDALRRPERFDMLLQAWEIFGRSDLSLLRRALKAARAVDAGSLAARHRGDVAAIASAIRAGRLAAIEHSITER